MTDATEPTRYAARSSYEAWHPDAPATLTRDQAVLIDEVSDDSQTPASTISLVNDEKAGVYSASVGNTTEIARLVYNAAGEHRLILLATSVVTEFRKQGIATELIRRVLNDVRADEKTITIFCPVVRTFVEHNPLYADLVDPGRPGMTKWSRSREDPARLPGL
jgi:predicted GNAT family acetyltransferase